MKAVPLEEKELDPPAARGSSAMRAGATPPRAVPGTSPASTPVPNLIPTPTASAAHDGGGGNRCRARRGRRRPPASRRGAGPPDRRAVPDRAIGPCSVGEREGQHPYRT